MEIANAPHHHLDGGPHYAEFGSPRSIYTSYVISRAEIQDWSGLLARPCMDAPDGRSLEVLRGASILVTGAAGSIGSALAVRLAGLRPTKLVLLDASESQLFDLRRKWTEAHPAVSAIFRLGSVRDRVLLEEIFEVHKPDLVFHAAAFKHVPLLEEEPLAAIENNVFGTLALAKSSVGSRLILLSTDKAVAPISVMGATKRVAEQIVLNAGGAALRLGNVLSSRGSASEVFASQIAAGVPLTITDAAASRYFLTLDEAVNLLLFAALELPTLLAPVLPKPHRVEDLARFMARELAPDRAIPIRLTGLRAGDRLTEQFWSAEETATPTKATGLLTIQSPLPTSANLQGALLRLRDALIARDVASALSELRGLVPDYTPSATLLSLVSRSDSGVNA